MPITTKVSHLRGFTLNCASNDGTRMEADVLQGFDKRTLCMSMFGGEGIEITDPEDVQVMIDALSHMKLILEGSLDGAITPPTRRL